WVGVAVHSPPNPAPVSPVKLVGGRADGSQVNASAPVGAGRLGASVPLLPRYHDWARVPGTGKRENERSNALSGAPGVALPAPLSKSTRTAGSRWNAASAAA